MPTIVREALFAGLPAGPNSRGESRREVTADGGDARLNFASACFD